MRQIWVLSPPSKLLKNRRFIFFHRAKPYLSRIFENSANYFEIRTCGSRIHLLDAASPDTFGTYHDAVVAELVDAQR
jgi:hypothetical protein